MIIHIIPAEKFVDRAIQLFEKAVPKQNVFYIFSQEANGTDLDLVKSKESKYVIKIPFDTKWWKKGFIDFKKYKHIFLHNLYSPQNIYFARKTPKALIKHSMIWGHEFYGFKPFWNKENCGKLTSKLNDQLQATNESSNDGKKIPNKNKFQYLVNRSWKLLTDKEYSVCKPTVANRREAFKASNFIHTHVKTDFKNVQKTFELNAKWSNFSYYTVEDYEFNQSIPSPNKILVGNSATASNNHLEVFQICKKKLKNNSFEMICPLNYGDKNYAHEIEKQGELLFDNSFNALRNFLPLEEYNNIQSACGIVIMNHYRQQGAGNLIASLLFGAKVFMNKRSPLYQHFKQLGLHIYDVEKDLNQNQLTSNLEKQEIEQNRAILKEYYSLNTQIESIHNSIKVEH